MGLTCGEFFRDYMIHPSLAPTTSQQNLCLAGSIAIGILTLGLAHLGCLAYEKFSNKNENLSETEKKAKRMSQQLLKKDRKEDNPVKSGSIITKHIQTPKNYKRNPINTIKRFSTWINTRYPVNEYKEHLNEKEINDIYIKQNLLAIQQTLPDPEKALHLGIKGDGDCAFRSIAVGLTLQEASNQPGQERVNLLQKITNIETLFSNEIAKSNESISPLFEKFFECSDLLKIELKNKCQPPQDFQTAFQTCMNNDFDRTFIQYLRVSSSLYQALYQEKMPENCQNILITESNGDILPYLVEKSRTEPQVVKSNLFGNLADAYALGQLFNKSITWLSIGNYLGANTIIPFLAENANPEDHLYLLNTPEHIDLLLTHLTQSRLI